MNDIQNNISTQSTLASSPAHHQTNGVPSAITNTPDSLPSQPTAPTPLPPPSPPPTTQKRRIYCLNTRQHRPSKPSASQDLIALYNLTPLTNAVARFDPITGKKNTMRKSYQGHIKDLPGKNMINPDNVIREIIRVPESEADTFVGPRNIRRLERDVLEGFGVMPGLIPDFDPSLLGLDDDQSEYDHHPSHHLDAEDSDTYTSHRRKKKRRSEDTDLEALSGTEDRKKKRKKNSEDEMGYFGGYRG